jgi:hypothetical protein
MAQLDLHGRIISLYASSGQGANLMQRRVRGKG